MVHRTTASLLFALLLLPTASALNADLSATSLRANGSTAMTAPLVGFIQQQYDAESGGANSQFQLRAQHLRIETDDADPVVHVNGQTNRPTSTKQDYEDAFLQGIANREYYRWLVLPAQGSRADVSTSSDCAEIAPSEVAKVERGPKVHADRGYATADTSAALTWTGCSQGASITITGDILLVMWEWDATLTAAQATETLQSGRFQSAYAPAVLPDGRAVLSHDRELYLFATNATLMVPNLTGTGYELFVGAGTEITAGAAELSGAVGDLDVAGTVIALTGDLVKIEGALQFTLAGKANVGFEVKLGGNPSVVSINGQTIALPTGAVPTGWMTPVAGAIFLLSASGVLWRQSPSRAVRRALQLAGHGRHSKAVKIANRAGRRRPSNPTILSSQACVLTEAGLLDAALLVHDRVKDVVPENPSAGVLNAIQAAETCMALNRPAEAVAWVELAYRVDPLRAWGAILGTPLEQFRPGVSHDPSYS